MGCVTLFGDFGETPTEFTPDDTSSIAARTLRDNFQYPAPNPNPTKFECIKAEVVNNHTIAEIVYSGCTTFEGRKLLVLSKPLTLSEINDMSKLDPHFLNDTHIVVARFVPNEQGWKLARKCLA